MANGPQDNGSERGVIVEGYIKLHRKIMQSFVYSDAECLKLFLHILLRANHAPSKVLMNGRVIELSRGQFITSISKLATETRIERTKTQRLLNVIRSEKIIDTQNTTKYSLISVVNYEKYQTKNDTHLIRNRYASDTHLRTDNKNKECKEVKEEKEEKETSKSTSLAESPARELLPHQVFVEKFKAAYKAKTGAEYEATKLDYIHTSGLIKKHGVEAVEQKAGMLARGCEQGLYWFTKDAGWGAFTIGKLCKFWNEIVPIETKEQKEQREMYECLKKQEAQREWASSVSRRQ